MKTHFHFIIWGAERIEPGTGNYIENTTIEVIADGMEKALEKAKVLVPGKKLYVMRQCIEHFGEQCQSGHS